MSKSKLTAAERILLRRRIGEKKRRQIEEADRDRWAKGDYRKRKYR